jgi:general secretion pathway protein J
MRTPSRRATAGFTLIEALLATALMGAILAALATITAQWLPNWNRGFVRVQRAEQLSLGLERLVGDLAAAEFIGAGRDPKPMFEGSELSVAFVRTALGPNTRPGLEIVRIAETGSAQGPILVRTKTRFVPNLNDRMAANLVDPVVLVRSPFRVTFAYAGADRVWQRSWRDAAQLPRAVRVTVRDDRSGRTLAASTATLVHVQVPVDCMLQNTINDCLAQRANAPGTPGAPGAPGVPGAPGGPPRQL